MPNARHFIRLLIRLESFSHRNENQTLIYRLFINFECSNIASANRISKCVCVCMCVLSDISKWFDAYKICRWLHTLHNFLRMQENVKNKTENQVHQYFNILSTIYFLKHFIEFRFTIHDLWLCMVWLTNLISRKLYSIIHNSNVSSKCQKI